MMESAVRACPAGRTVEAALSAAGFRSVAIEPWDVPPDLEDKFLYAGKDRPELYFDKGFRSGISAFRELAGAEVAQGLDRLRADLDSGRWRTDPRRRRARHGRLLLLHRGVISLGDCGVPVAGTGETLRPDADTSTVIGACRGTVRDGSGAVPVQEPPE